MRRALVKALRKKKIERPEYNRWRREYLAARRTVRRLRGARQAQLTYVIATAERLALSGRLTASRMPVVFLQMERNREYWRSLPFPATGDRVTFKGSEILFQYFPGRGLQLHPLSTFKKANLIHGACVRDEPGCDRAVLARVLDEMQGLAVWRNRRFIAWEYMFHFGGGAPPWMSGMAQATGMQAYAARPAPRPARLPDTARRALGAFETPRRRDPDHRPTGGIAYLQYSFAPRLLIFNAFLQSLIGLYDYARLPVTREARGSSTTPSPRHARGAAQRRGRLVALQLRRARVATATTTSCCASSSRACARAGSANLLRLREEVPRLPGRPARREVRGPELTTKDELTALRFSVSKLSAVEVTVSDGRKVAFDRSRRSAAATDRSSGRPRSPSLHAFGWPPRSPHGARQRKTRQRRSRWSRLPD